MQLKILFFIVVTMITSRQFKHKIIYSNNPKKLDVSKERNNELDLMVFQEVSDMVISQGTILDRIDNNLYQSRYNVRRGNREIEEIHFELNLKFLFFFDEEKIVIFIFFLKIIILS